MMRRSQNLVGTPPPPPTELVFVGISSSGLNHHRSTPLGTEGEPSFRLANILGLQHYAIFLNEMKYEVTGARVQTINVDPITLAKFKNEFPKIIAIDVTSKPKVSKTAAAAFAADWSKKHPSYDVYSSNCQLFVRDFLYHLYQEKFVTQSLTLGRILVYMSVGILVVAVVLSFCMLTIALNLMQAHGKYEYIV